MFSNFISASKVLDIELLEPVVHLHGRRADAVLRGTIGVTVNKPHTLKSLVLLFEGESRLLHGNRKVSRRRIAHHQLVLYPTTPTIATANHQNQHHTSPFLLQPGTSRFGFEMQLPPGLAGTIHCDEINIEYNLVASIQYSHHSSSLAVIKRRIKKPVHLVRPPWSSTLSVLVDGENIDASIDSRKQHSRWCQYHITIDQRSIILGQVLPITLKMAPHIDGLRLEHLYTQIVERRHVREKEDNGEWETHKYTHMLLPIQDDESSSFTPGKSVSIREPWQGTLSYRISSVMEGGLVRTCKRENPDHFIDHTINISFVISFPVLCRRGETRRFTKTIMFQSDIELLDPNVCYSPPSPKSTLTTIEGTAEQQQHQQSAYIQGLPPYEEPGSPSGGLSSLLMASPEDNDSYLSPPPISPGAPPTYDEVLAL
ncbi:hypothetical protein BDA99DRAFT_557783 [Phascolomyces articulosus]|uniref:Arrestin-like N-terminal domain-containing protein n=1 Tax=Phascolomyces articulosus TaxID=60185 RepID=A0AAD5KF50_9FUNG|nr:hypothetical protein BDA99DRAFT_557783 [Phascolomyces articulosus]